MNNVIRQISLWDGFGAEYTTMTIEAAVKRAVKLNVSHIVVASTSGNTAVQLDDAINEAYIQTEFKRPELCCVTHSFGFAENGKDEMSSVMRTKLTSRGVKVLTTTHLMGGIDRAVGTKFSGLYPAGIVAQTLKMYGQGTKVAIECATMCLDAGFIPYGEDIIAIGGSQTGCDTAILFRPANAMRFFDGKIREIICKPRDF